jgi:hypothetical protein
LRERLIERHHSTMSATKMPPRFASFRGSANGSVGTFAHSHLPEA